MRLTASLPNVQVAQLLEGLEGLVSKRKRLQSNLWLDHLGEITDINRYRNSRGQALG